MSRKTIISLIAFALGVLFFTRIDYLVNYTLYFHGLQFSWNWYTEYSLLYQLGYQLLALLILLYNRNIKLFSIMEGYILSGGPDLVFWIAWTQGDHSTTWGDWCFYYRTFGFWGIVPQFVLTTLVVVSVIGIWKIVKWRNQHGS